MADICRRSAIRRATAGAKLPAYASDMRPVRGRCHKRRCGSRWGVARVSIDFRGDRIDRLATVECAACGRTWSRCRVPDRLTSAAGYQAVWLTLILPAVAHRWFARNRWHSEGSDGIVLREANIGDLDEAARAHRARLDVKAATAIRARDKREASDREAVARMHATLAALDAREAAREADDRDAAAREAAYA